ncbi:MULTISPECIES: O-antigen ligase family protein [Clostridium]|uniref:O-antigen ligase family protein n=1 Tax=Clostridium TaxID=1485 RepID=UPI00136DAEC9|nr:MULTISPECIES: O-antigen ligase family protein [Clostridium]
MIIELLIFIMPFIIPYTIIGFDGGNILLTLVSLMYILLRRKKIRLNKVIIFLLISLLFLSVISAVTKFSILALNGLSLYLAPIFYYVIYSYLKDHKRKDDIMKYTVYIMAVLSVIFIVYEGVFLKLRIFGLVGYANTFALSLLILIHINNIREYDGYKVPIDIIFISSILFTGSRNTLVYMFVYIIFAAWKSKSITHICNILVSTILYILVAELSIIGFLLAPILIYLYMLFEKKISDNSKKSRNVVILVASIILIIAIASISGSNSIERVRNISINNGSMQERFIIFEDTMRAIKSKPLGHGINTFSKYQYYLQSAYYDVKYVHNSLLQIGFDIGILGIIPFLLLLIYGVVKSFKKITDRQPLEVLNLVIFVLIFLHSFLDFDFSFASIFALWLLPLSLELKNDFEFNVSDKVAMASLCSLSIFLVLILYNEGIIKLGNYFTKYGNYSTGRNITKTALFKDSRYYEVISDSYKQQYSYNQDSKLLKQLEINLEKAISCDRENLNLKWDMAYIKGKLGEKEDAISLWNEVVDGEKYYFDAYKTYYDYLQDIKAKDGASYKKQLEALSARHREAYDSLNTKSKYLKNQLKESLSDTIEMKR